MNMKARFHLMPAIFCVLLFSGINLQAQFRQPVVSQNSIVSDNNALQLQISPNPVKAGGQISYSYAGPDNQSVTFRVINVIGRTVYENTLFHDSGEINDIVNLGQLPKGLYFFQAASANQTITHRLLIME